MKQLSVILLVVCAILAIKGVNNAAAGSILVDPYPTPIEPYPTPVAYPVPVEPIIATITPELEPVVVWFNELQVIVISNTGRAVKTKTTAAILVPEIERTVGRGNKTGSSKSCGMQLQVGFRIIHLICK